MACRIFYQPFLSFLIAIVLLSLGCGTTKVEPSKVTAAEIPTEKTKVNGFSKFVDNEGGIADGFSFALNNKMGWHKISSFGERAISSIQSGEDWQGLENADPSVYSVANGRVLFAQDCGNDWGNIIIIEHNFYENYEQKTIYSVYRHLSQLEVKKDDFVKKQQMIATIAQESNQELRLNLELRWDRTLSPTFSPSEEGKSEEWINDTYISPTEFISRHQNLLVPQNEATLVLVDTTSYKMRLYQKGEFQGEYEVSFGQSKGQKQFQGDNKTPRGMYFVVYKHRGKFDGAYGNYYGGHWIKINYPNPDDAARGKSAGLLTSAQEAIIQEKWGKRLPTLENTSLGGGIGFHGWAKEWSNEGPRHLSWGCVVLHIYDISRLYDKIPEGTMVIIF